MRKFRMELTEKEAWAFAAALEQALIVLTNRCKAGVAHSLEIDYGLEQLEMLIDMNEALMLEESFRKQKQRLYGYKGYLTQQLRIVREREKRWAEQQREQKVD